MYQKKSRKFLNKLRWIFSFIINDTQKDTNLICRDHIGIISLYMGYDKHGNFCFALEIKALISGLQPNFKNFLLNTISGVIDSKMNHYYQV
ncbi:MAG: hypothetical protein ACMUEK_00195 [Sodalis sp. (in: enterobacteria)]